MNDESGQPIATGVCDTAALHHSSFIIHNSLSWLPFLLQTADALFPTGAYAHSLGFEESVRLGTVHNEATLGDFLIAQILPALRQHELPYLRAACEAAARADLDALCALDRQISAWKLARELRDASIQLGMRRLKALRVLGPCPASALLESFEAAIAQGRACGHQIVVCGIQSTAMPVDAALSVYCYQALSAICAAALKLIRIGQDGCQRALHRACAHAEDTLRRARAVPVADAGWFNPMLEIAAMRHAHADERLFIS